MIDTNGNEIEDEELIKESMDLLASACEMLFETTSNEGKSLAFMVDCALKYAQVIHRGHDILMAATDYDQYEYDYGVEQKKIKDNIKIIK